MGSDAAAEDTVKRWFADHEFGHLQLPDGWFGKPWDNQHALTFVVSRPERLLIEIDEQLLLVLDGPVTARTSVDPPDSAGWAVSAVTLENFAQCVFDRRGYGGDDWHAKVYDHGSVRFLRHIAAND